MRHAILLITPLSVLAACTSVTINPIDPTIAIKSLCIQENPKVQIADFVSVIRDGLDRHGVASEVFSGPKPERCEYILTYTALRSWDFTPYLSHAELRIEKNGRQIAFAEYHLNGKGGLSFKKWDGTRQKMNPVIDGLFKQQ